MSGPMNPLANESDQKKHPVVDSEWTDRDLGYYMTLLQLQALCSIT
jgi:hypothetical protein